MIGGFGGGFFFAPFTSTQVIGTFTVTSGAGLAVLGPWVHRNPVLLTAGATRWMELDVWPAVYGSEFTVQIGIGPAGSEVLFQPSTGNGFFIDWFSQILWTVPFRISFPVSVPVGSEFSIRCASAPAPGQAVINCAIYIWN
jgi:hypothetical protein